MNDMNENVIYSYGINKNNEINLIQEYIDDNPREVFESFYMRIDIYLLWMDYCEFFKWKTKGNVHRGGRDSSTNKNIRLYESGC